MITQENPMQPMVSPTIDAKMEGYEAPEEKYA